MQSYLLKYAEEAKGIPDRSNYGSLSDLPLNKLLTFVVQKHDARKAKLHYDVRLGDKDLHSFVSKKGLPSPGQKRLFIHQPIHSLDYANFQGVIESGYGAGEVKTDDLGKAVVTKNLPDKINFTLLHKKYPEYFSLIKTDDKKWLALNTTPTYPDKLIDNPAAFEKLKMKAVKDIDVNQHLISAKLSGASNLFKLNKNNIDVVSYRTSKTGRPIIHTDRFFGLNKPKINIPDNLVGTILRGELYGTIDNKAIPEQQLGGLLNASVLNSINKQKEKDIKLRAALFDIVGFKGSPDQRRSKIKDILKHLPKQFEEPPYAETPIEASRLIKDIKSGKHRLTSEGIVGWNRETGEPVKQKNFEEADVYFRGFSQGLGRLENKGIGAIKYSLTPKGPIVGEVASGLSDDTRKDIYNYPDDYIGRTVNISHRGQGESGAYFQPVFLGFHESPRIKQAYLDGFIRAASLN